MKAPLIKHYPLLHFNERPAGLSIDSIVIHSMYARDYRHKTAAINCFRVLDDCKVSAHYSIDRKGGIWQHVPDSKRAWHAGESSLEPCRTFPEGKNNFNDFSIGIELIAVFGRRFTASQYRSLNCLLSELIRKYPIKMILAHSRIAPGRKQDPGPSFRWNLIKRPGKYPQVLS